MMPSEVQTVVQKLTRLPQLPIVMRQLDKMLAQEQQRRREFYEWLTEDVKAEFINGEIMVQSPVKLRHGRAGQNLFKLLSTFVERHELGFVGHEKLLVSLTRNDYEPDICFWSKETAAHFTPDQMHFPAPDFIVEVLSPSTEQVDRETKLPDYASHDVLECWLIDPDTETVEQYLLRAGEYALHIKAQTGTITSAAVPGFTIPLRAIFDAQENVAALARIVQE